MEITFFRPAGNIGKGLADLLSEKKLLITTVYKESDSTPRLFIEGRHASLNGENTIRNFLNGYPS